MANIYIECMLGLGDTIYQRPFIKAASKLYTKVWVKTAWPEFFKDLPNVFPVMPQTSLRTQKRNIKLHNNWVSLSRGVKPVTLEYTPYDLDNSSIMLGLYKRAPWAKNLPSMDMPKFDIETHQFWDGKTPLAIVRPVTKRLEWESSSRACDPKYIQQSINILRDKGFHVILLYDVDGELETFVGEKPHDMHVDMNSSLNADYAKGSFVAGLFQRASVVVGSVGWIVPFGIATGVPTFVIHGGKGRHNRPNVLEPLGGVQYAPHLWHCTPKFYCMCDKEKHDCDKTIENFEDQLLEFLKEYG